MKLIYEQLIKAYQETGNEHFLARLNSKPEVLDLGLSAQHKGHNANALVKPHEITRGKLGDSGLPSCVG